MRQAGRYLPEYRALRERHSMMELLSAPELAVEATLQPLRRFPLDAAIIFMDILPPLAGMGLEISFGAGSGGGPHIGNPISSTRDIDVSAVPPAAEALTVHLEAIAMAREELASSGTPLIGFTGAPFTLASYAIEGSGSRNYAKTKSLMYAEPAAWKRLMSKLVTVLADFLTAQARAGAAALQVFDSWAGIALGRDDYVRYVQPYNRQLFTAVRAAGVPVINFSTGTGAYIEDVAACGGDVIGVDWRLPIDSYRKRIGSDQAIQGNLDPVALLAPWRELKPRIETILASAGGSGHLFNLGHGILPETPMDSVARLVDHVHAWNGAAQ
jgi:uroporphyrinogen decarboxylase